MNRIIIIAAILLAAVPAQARQRTVSAQGPVFSGGLWSYPVAAPRGTVIVHRHAARRTPRQRSRLARHIRRDPGITHATPLRVAGNGLVAPLAEKVAQITRECGSRVVSAVRHTYIAGTHHISLHASGKAADVAGNPSCIYSMLHGWSGGYSVDYGRVRHVHISYDPDGGREWGARFQHYAHHRRHHHLHHRRHLWA